MPTGVVLVLSTRFCLEPERGVTLLVRNGATGAGTSSLYGAYAPITKAVGVDDAEVAVVAVATLGLCERLPSGVTRAGDFIVATFGVRGVRLTTLAAAALS